MTQPTTPSGPPPPRCGKTARTTRFNGPYTLICSLVPEHKAALCLDMDEKTWFEPQPRPVDQLALEGWPRRAWELGLLHHGGDPHKCPVCVAQPQPPPNFICPGAEANEEVLRRGPTPAEPEPTMKPALKRALDEWAKE